MHKIFHGNTFARCGIAYAFKHLYYYCLFYSTTKWESMSISSSELCMFQPSPKIYYDKLLPRILEDLVLEGDGLVEEACLSAVLNLVSIAD